MMRAILSLFFFSVVSIQNLIAENPLSVPEAGKSSTELGTLSETQRLLSQFLGGQKGCRRSLMNVLAPSVVAAQTLVTQRLKQLQDDPNEAQKILLQELLQGIESKYSKGDIDAIVNLSFEQGRDFPVPVQLAFQFLQESGELKVLFYAYYLNGTAKITSATTENFALTLESADNSHNPRKFKLVPDPARYFYTSFGVNSKVSSAFGFPRSYRFLFEVDMDLRILTLKVLPAEGKEANTILRSIHFNF